METIWNDIKSALEEFMHPMPSQQGTRPEEDSAAGILLSSAAQRQQEGEIWGRVKELIKGEMPAHTYRMWIDPIGFKEWDGNRAILYCPNLFSKKRVQDHYAKMIADTLGRLTGRRCTVAIDVEAPDKNGNKRRNRLISPPDIQLALPVQSVPRLAGRHLRKEFTFDRFVVSQNNQFAYSAALSVASRQNIHQNSLFLLSETGLGKSHLSQAIGHHILSHFPNESVCYVTAEDFTNEMIRAFKNNDLEEFKRRYRDQCDVLLLEDIHFLSGKDRTQVELAFALDHLLDAHKKIIFTSCYLPGDIPKMSDQLKSRLASGLISHIEPPDFNARLKILQIKLKEHGIRIPKTVLEYLATELCDNVRQLESGLVSVTTKSSLLGQPIDLRLAESVVENITQRRKAITIDWIKTLVCREYNVTTEALVSKSRKQAIVRPRQVAIYLARKFTDHPLQAIGKSFNRYHATAIHSINAVEKGMKTDASFCKQVELLSRKLESGE